MTGAVLAAERQDFYNIGPPAEARPRVTSRIVVVDEDGREEPYKPELLLPGPGERA